MEYHTKIDRFISSESLALSDAESRLLKNKIKVLVAHLVKTHIDNGGCYFEADGDDNFTDSDSINIIKSPSSHKVIATKLLPYVVWLTNKYIYKFYGQNLDFFEFHKLSDERTPNFFNLDFTVKSLAKNNFSLFLMFLVVAFQDKFESSERNKIVINRLPLLINGE